MTTFCVILAVVALLGAIDLAVYLWAAPPDVGGPEHIEDPFPSDDPCLPPLC